MRPLDQGVGFVDKEYASHRPVHRFAGLGRGLAEIGGHEVSAGDFHHVGSREHSERVQHSAHQPGHRGLAGAGVAEEEVVVAADALELLAFYLCFELALLEFLDHKAYLLLDVFEADQGVELRHALLLADRLRLLVGDVLRHDGEETVAGDFGVGQGVHPRAHEPETLVKQVAGLAGVAEGLARLFCGKLPERRHDLRKNTIGQLVALAFGVAPENLGKFLGGVVFDMDAVGEAACQTVVDLQKIVHLVLVTGADHHELAPVVLHPGHEPLDGLDAFAVVALAHLVDRGERIRLVDEQHAAHGFVHGFVHLLRGFIGIAGHYVLAALFHNPVGGADAHGLEEFAEHTGDRGLAGAGVAGQEYVDGTDRSLAALFHSLALETHFFGEQADGGLHRAHTDELVELPDDLLHSEVLALVVAHDVGPGEDSAFLLIFLLGQRGHPAVEAGEAALEDVAHLAGVAEDVGAREVHALEVLVYLACGFLVEGVAFSGEHAHEYFLEFGSGVVLELDFLVEARVEAGVGAQEAGHLAGVAGDDADEVSAAVLQEGEQGVDGLLAGVVVVVLLERVGLVDEEYASHGLVDHLLGLYGRVAHVLRHQVLAHDLHKVAVWQHLETVQYFGEKPGDGGLSGSGVAQEHVV